MRSSRVLRSSVDTLSKGFLLPERTGLDIAASAINAWWSMLWDDKYADDFRELTKKGVIQEQVLSNSAWGSAMVFALHGELGHPDLKGNGFKAEEFLKGVEPALMQFHKVKNSLSNRCYELDVSDGGDEQDTASRKDLEEELFGLMGGVGLMRGELSGESDGSAMKKLAPCIFEWDWEKEAKENPESDEGELYRMVIPPVFHRMQASSKGSYIVEKFTKEKVLIDNDSLQLEVVSASTECVCVNLDSDSGEAGHVECSRRTDTSACDNRQQRLQNGTGVCNGCQNGT